MESYYRIILLDCITGLYYGTTLQDYMTNVFIILHIYVTKWYSGIVSRNHITKLYYQIPLRTYPHETNLGDPWGVPRAPWDIRNAGTPRGTPLGPPGHPADPHGPQNQRYHTKSTAPEALGCNMLQRMTPKTPLDCFTVYRSRTEPFLVGRTKWDPRFQERGDAH